MKLIEKAKSAELGRYELTFQDMADLIDVAQARTPDAILDALWLSYKLGFLRGQRVGRKGVEI